MTDTGRTPLDVRSAAGRARRTGVPRGAHAEWTAPPDRADPVRLVEAANEDRLPDLVPVRHGRMGVSAFTFFRGTAEIMASDLASTPHTGITAQLCGDAHLSNFGLYASPERSLVFDLNDFDETIVGPWEWDIKRLATSFEIAGRDVSMSAAQRRAASSQAVRSYREHLWTYASMSPLEIRYDRRDLRDIVALASTAAERKTRAEAERHARKRDATHLLPKLTEFDGTTYRIRDAPPLVFHPPTEDWEHLVHDFLDAYRESLRHDVRLLFDRYRFADAAAKVSGVGSVGTRCFIALFLSDDDQPLILQAKEAGPSALGVALGADPPEHGGERVVTGQRVMQAVSDMMLGWGRSDAGRDFYVRQLRDMKFSVSTDSVTPAQLTKYAEFCGWTLARAHASSSDAATIAGYLGHGPRFDESVAAFAVAYAEQNELDYACFVEAIRTGRLEATVGA